MEEVKRVRHDLGARTNWNLLVNAQTLNTYRPGNYRVSRGMLVDYMFGTLGNSEPTETLFYDDTYSNSTVTALYSAYSPQVEPLAGSSPPPVPESMVAMVAGSLIFSSSTNLS